MINNVLRLRNNVYLSLLRLRLAYIFIALYLLMVNCGRCGRPMYKPGEFICEFCKKTVVKDATRHSARMNRKSEQEEEMFMNLAAPGQDEPDMKEDMRYEHYTDTHDASAVWVDEGAKKGKKRGR